MAIELRADGARAVLLPEYGGRLHQLFVSLDGAEEPLLASPQDLRSYTAAPTEGGSFPMAPWPNRIRHGRFHWAGRDYAVPTNRQSDALHGFVAGVEWNVVARTGGVCEMVVPLDDRWPWPGRVWQRFELAPGELRMTMEVRAGREQFPAGCGWHPWFRRSVSGVSEARVQVPASRRYVLERHLPTGRAVVPAGEFDLRSPTLLGDSRLDDCYAGLSGPLVIDWGNLRLELDVTCPEPHVMVYSPEDAFCIEPQTCVPDAFNLAAAGMAGTGFAVAEPGRPVGIACTWRWATRR